MLSKTNQALPIKSQNETLDAFLVLPVTEKNYILEEEFGVQLDFSNEGFFPSAGNKRVISKRLLMSQSF